MPFGPRAAPRQGDAPPASPDAPPSPDAHPPSPDAPPRSLGALPPSVDAPRSLDAPPPSAEDFWGEHSAAVQSALQAPAVHENVDGDSGRTPAIRPRRVDRRAVAGVAAVLAIAAVAAIVVASSAFAPGGTPERATGSKVGFAAVLSGGVSSILRLDLGRIHVARGTAAEVRRAPHRPPSPRPDHKTVRRRVTPPVRSSTQVVSAPAPAYHPPTTDTSYATSAGSTDTHADTPPATRSISPRSASRPVASRATVSATGESGALGPIQSPNG